MAPRKKTHFYSIAFQYVIAVLLISLITFPNFSPSFGIGLDTSYIWAFNFLFNNNYESLSQLVYPVGPLGFLKFPTTEGNNLALAIAFYSLLKIWFLALFLNLSQGQPGKLKFATVLLLLIISYFLSLDFLVIGITALHVYIMVEHRRWWHIIPASMLAVAGLMIKSSIGVTAMSVIFAGLVFFAIRFKNLRDSIIQLLAAGAVSLALCVLVSGGFKSCIMYSINALRLSFSYSEALALFPYNNWWLLAGFIFTVCLIPLINRSQTRRLFFLLLLPAFAMWKYGLGRQDIYHYATMLQFFIVFWGLMITLSERFKLRNLVLAAISISLFYSNMQHIIAPEYRPLKVEINGINNFSETVIQHAEFRKRHSEISARNLADNTIPAEIRTLIGEASVDVYPWELSFIPANNLNWKPRTTLQSGSFSRWLDRRNADDFCRIKGPEFLIFHFVKDKWGGDLGSIDGRYLLNDNPLTIYNILNHYDLIQKTGKFLLFRKNQHDRLKPAETSDEQYVGWNQWIDVPDYSGKIVRMKIAAETSLKGKWIGFWYKTSPYYVDYRMDDGKMLSFRFIPDNARDGIWINPFIRFPANNIKESKVKAIRFRANDTRFVKDQFPAQFEFIGLAGVEPNQSIAFHDAEQLFGKTQAASDSIIFSKTQTFEFDKPSLLSEPFPDCLDFSGTNSAVLEGQGFSFTWICRLEKLWPAIDLKFSGLLFETDVFYQNTDSEAHLVISVSDSDDDFWMGQNLPQNPTKNTEYQYAYANRTLRRSEHPKGVLTVYVWNSGNKPISIDDFRFSIKALVVENP